MQTASVYALVDPRDDIIRYVGVSKTPEVRYKQHMSNSGEGDNSDKAAWIKELKTNGAKPRLSILEKGIPLEEKVEREEDWIRDLVESGVRLLNKRGNPEEKHYREDIQKYDEPMQRKTVFLYPWMIEFGEELGNGTLAEGVRRALEQAKDQTNEE